MSDTEEAPLPPAPQVVSAGPHAPPPPQIYNFPRNFPISAAMVCRGDIPIGNFISPSETWFTKGMCLILIVKHPTKLLTVNRLRKLTSSCQYGALTQYIVRDRLVICIQDKNTKARLLRERALSLDKALDMC